MATITGTRLLTREGAKKRTVEVEMQTEVCRDIKIYGTEFSEYYHINVFITMLVHLELQIFPGSVSLTLDL